MTHIRFSEDEKKLYLIAHGHAGFAPAGQDIVCAAVSALVFGLGTAVAGCKDYSFRTDSETSAIEVSASSEDQNACILFHGFIEALSALSATEPYDRYVSLNVDTRE